MNLEVVKHCATVLFLESSQSDSFTENWVSLNATNGVRHNGNANLNGTASNTSLISHNRNIENHTIPPNHIAQENTMVPPVDKMETENLQSNEAMIAESSTTTLSDAFSNHSEFLEPDAVSMASITVNVAPFFNGSPKLQILHRNIPMQIRCDGMRVRFGLSTQFVDHAGRPRLSFVVDVNSSNLCNILDACDNIAKRFLGSDSNSEWRPVVTRKPGFYNSPTIRLHIPTVTEDSTRWTTEIYHKESSLSTSIQPLVSSRYDVAELDSLFRPSSLVDVYFSLDPYNYQQNAGIRLVAKKLIVHTN
ncbi:polynucleotidyl transferase, ribonuclease H-like superfamily protein [Artemisia annua]|uniref:Polynucleotidyl transferase, ribonuclease H-like superfamily protein n=1 Tax=Artemisia annua TaxID=35608 RepID=A0A2U1MJ90_ARTAN|nr:polynucleotidyl transferase, ribonuclease H-like superfamily protein [Artemisia annua]